ncbi:MAG: DMT family transporter [Bdellovibrionaceae bacterium]|nr:DMT family transporter [Bdellovibrio sp.]
MRLRLQTFANTFTPYQRAVALLVFAASIWGISFTAIRWALTDFTTTHLVFWRFLIALVAGELLQFLFQPKVYKRSGRDFRLALFAGIALGLSIVLQTQGLQTTTATQSSFITSLYVVMLPIVAGLFFRQRIKAHHIFLGLIAFSGMALLLNLHQTDFQFHFGDLLTLGCALASTFHIIYVGAAANQSTSNFRFNNFQTLWALLMVTPFIAYEIFVNGLPLWPHVVHFKSVLGLLILSLFASLVAFYLQIKAQKVLPNTTSSLLCLLEAPYAFIFAALLLDESLNGVQLIGVLVIMTSSVAAVYIDRPKNR